MGNNKVDNRSRRLREEARVRVKGGAGCRMDGRESAVLLSRGSVCQ